MEYGCPLCGLCLPSLIVIGYPSLEIRKQDNPPFLHPPSKPPKQNSLFSPHLHSHHHTNPKKSAMAVLQQAAISLQSKLPSASRTPRPLPALNLSFSATFPSLKLPSSTRHRSGGFKTFNTVASTYASALAELADRNNSLETTIADLEKVEEVISDPDVLKFFSSPIISLEKKRGLVDEIVKSYSLQPQISNFLNLLIDAQRIEAIKDIIVEFELVYNKLTNTELAVVSSVVKLESENLAQIAKQVQKLTGAKNVRIKNVIDPSLLAGFTIRYGISGSKLIDMSIKKQLQEIASQLDLGDIQLVG